MQNILLLWKVHSELYYLTLASHMTYAIVLYHMKFLWNVHDYIEMIKN